MLTVIKAKYFVYRWLLWALKQTFGFSKGQGISYPAEKLSAFQEGLSSVNMYYYYYYILHI